ncbi:hypothetical protein GCM10010326_77570 [Streptomyces xanthochromogenes]|uniref:Uncharacterized protein n=1 Tax=Streptomyces xanthochromogenes TaxID=67384 RepID=A0ABQ3AYK8_9ACTN|nr:hypothetical protein GCM10010326_77570 [Streptomyces xanthochromogenes]
MERTVRVTQARWARSASGLFEEHCEHEMRRWRALYQVIDAGPVAVAAAFWRRGSRVRGADATAVMSSYPDF